MSKNERYQLIVELVRRLNQGGSWTGNTHIQKSMFFLQHLFKVPLEYKFVIYHYGPFSFELDTELALALARGWLEIRPEPGYGVHYRPGKKTSSSEAQIPCEYDKKLDAVVNLFGSSNVKQLELLATTYYVVNGLDGEQRDLDTAFRRIHQLKPHFTVEAIKIGYEQLREKMAAMLD